ncbi:MAG: hypothetical protein ABWX82_01025 [Leifsonia sp.]
MAAPEATPKPALVAILAIVVLAVVALAGVYLLMGPVPDGFDRPALTDVLAITASVIAPIVSIAAAYYGVTIALKASSEATQIMRRATETSLEAADNFTTAITNITVDLHNQNLQLIESLQRGGAFAAGPDDDHARSVPTATGSTSVVRSAPTPASQHVNTSDVGLPDDET